ncbi:hypothetical protein EJ04DRAFT_515273 [Polyplosphaeria fusca]|uniref:Uncharacterized protein n=1 Tax=Polyplosphaeria fusca TaxID=682080 RepID=A0A9P4UZN2_9PLEO|nr:hypothetical protein EJ04DRAFT_515273 [Polyplosphaeria fusca]
MRANGQAASCTPAHLSSTAGLLSPGELREHAFRLCVSFAAADRPSLPACCTHPRPSFALPDVEGIHLAPISCPYRVHIARPQPLNALSRVQQTPCPELSLDPAILPLLGHRKPPCGRRETSPTAVDLTAVCYSTRLGPPCRSPFYNLRVDSVIAPRDDLFRCAQPTGPSASRQARQWRHEITQAMKHTVQPHAHSVPEITVIPGLLSPGTSSSGGSGPSSASPVLSPRFLLPVLESSRACASKRRKRLRSAAPRTSGTH